MHLTSIIILSYNTLDYTRLCIESIRQYTEAGSYEIIVIDNNSQDGSVEWLKEQGDIRCIFNAQNAGFPKGCNQGLEIAKGDELLLLNSDTVVTTNWLLQLRMALYSNERVGAVSCVTNYCSNRQAIAVPYRTIEEMQAFARNFNHSDARKWTKRTHLVMFCYLFKRSILDEIGYLDEIFTPGNFEDNDYSLRILQAGYDLLLCQDTFIHHFGSKSFIKKRTPEEEAEHAKRYNALLARNQILFNRKWHVPEVYSGMSPTDFADLMVERESGKIDNMAGDLLVSLKDVALAKHDIEQYIKILIVAYNLTNGDAYEKHYRALVPKNWLLECCMLHLVQKRQSELLLSFAKYLWQDELQGERLYYEALAHYQSAEWQKAQAKLLEIDDTLKDEFCWFYEGNVRYQLGEYIEAIDAYEKALQIRPGFSEVMANSALTLRQCGVAEYSALLQNQQAMDFFQQGELILEPWVSTLNLAKASWQDIPIFINSRDRVTCLRRLVDWFLEAGYRNIYILDNDSSYPPLSAYYEQVESECVHVLRLPNYGHTALWTGNILQQLNIDTPYVYTDSDIIPVDACPKDFVVKCLEILERYPHSIKVGLGIVHDDLTYFDAEVKDQYERGFYQLPVEDNLYLAPADTTLAVYRQSRYYHVKDSLRLTGEYMIRHLPWYYDYDNLPEEELYYLQNATESSSLKIYYIKKRNTEQNGR